MLNLYVKYFTDGIEPISKIEIGDWIDLRSAEDIVIKKGEYKNIHLGIGMILPSGYEAHVLPRSSTFKTWGILLVNGMGIIDESYNGDNDEWRFPALAVRDTTIHKNDRICQFRIMEKQPKLNMVTVRNLNETNRGGFGSTGAV